MRLCVRNVTQRIEAFRIMCCVILRKTRGTYFPYYYNILLAQRHPETTRIIIVNHYNITMSACTTATLQTMRRSP